MEKLIVTVKKISYQNPNTKFHIFEGLTTMQKMNSTGKVVKTKSKEIFLGTFISLFVNDTLEAYGYWVYDKKYGKQFRIEYFSKILPQSIKGIETFLKQTVKGFGDKKAKVLTDAYGENTLSHIVNDPSALDILPSTSAEKKQAIFNAIAENIEFENLLGFMQTSHLDFSIALKIYKQFKNESIITIKSNPYMLFDKDILSFSEADKIAHQLAFNPKSDLRLHYGLLNMLKMDSKDNGNLYTNYDYVLNNLNICINKKSSFPNMEFAKDEIKAMFKELKSKGKISIIKDAITGNKLIYLSNNLFVEKGIATLIKEKVSKRPCVSYDVADIDNAISMAEAKLGIILEQKQIAAVYASIANQISIITGGPGTGKTQTMAAAISVIQDLCPGAMITLCSPTGIAAKKMGEMSGMSASTIHRLIKLFSDDVKHSGEMIIGGDYVIVDEASLIDAKVFYCLLKAIAPKTQVIIIGDHNQLPSVGAGTVLRDFISSGIVPTTILTEVFRQAAGSNIIINAHKIINDEPPESLIYSKVKCGDFFFFETEEEKIPDKITKIVSALLKTYSLDQIQLLSPTKTTAVGTEAMNIMMQSTFGACTDMIEVGDTQYYVGDKVIHIQNDYDLNVFNGETGKISYINRMMNNIVRIDYKDKSVDYDTPSLSEIALAYSISIHKSQGSEFPVVIIPISKSNKRSIYQSLLYTAITRAKEKVILVGSMETFNEGLKEKSHISRNSLLKDRLCS